MLVCQACGKRNPPGFAYCPKCGASLEPRPDARGAKGEPVAGVDPAASARGEFEPGDADDDPIAALLQRGEKIAAIKLYRQRTGAGLAEAKRAIEAWSRRDDFRGGDLTAEVVELLNRGQKIGAIKRYRERTGADLVAAKRAVEDLMVEYQIAPQRRGCFGPTAVALALAGMALVAQANNSRGSRRAASHEPNVNNALEASRMLNPVELPQRAVPRS